MFSIGNIFSTAKNYMNQTYFQLNLINKKIFTNAQFM